MLTISAGNDVEVIYNKNYDSNKYEIIGLKSYSVIEEDGQYILKIDDVEGLITALQRAQKDIKEFNEI